MFVIKSVDETLKDGRELNLNKFVKFAPPYLLCTQLHAVSQSKQTPSIWYGTLILVTLNQIMDVIRKQHP